MAPLFLPTALPHGCNIIEIGVAKDASSMCDEVELMHSPAPDAPAGTY